MDDEKIINVAEEVAKKQPWYKRAWKAIKEWWYYNDENVLMFIWGALLGFWAVFVGWVIGLCDKDNNEAHYNAGKKEGTHEGYLEAIQDIKDSGYQVYGGYGEDCGKMVVTKLVEEAIKAEPTVEETAE